MLASIDWIAVGVATFAYYVLGALWFSPSLFGRGWDAALAFERPPRWRPGALYYLGPLVGCFLATVATAVVLAARVDAPAEAAALGAVAGIGYGAAVSFVNAINPRTARPLLYGAVTGSYHAVGITLAALLLNVLG